MDLLVIGPGVLGMLVAESWKRHIGGSGNIHLMFRSNDPERTKSLEAKGFFVAQPNSNVKCPNVVFCAPPTGNENYANDVIKGMDNLEGDGGVFVFTSSGSVYGENNGGCVDENSARVKQETGNSGKLIDAEDGVIAKGGCVMRLGGLYSAERGAHNFFGRGGQFSSKPGGLINIVHYEDAAEAVVAGLKNPSKAKGQVFLVSDGHPMSRQEIADATLASPLIKEKLTVEFTGGSDVDGKKYNTAKLRSELGWTPKYTTFNDFLKSL